MLKKIFIILPSTLLLFACASPDEPAEEAYSEEYEPVEEPSEEPTEELFFDEVEADSSFSDIQPGSIEDFVTNVGNVVYFDFDSSELSYETTVTLDAQVEWLFRYEAVTMTIEGHADERGTREYNLALGERRASAVRNYLIAQGLDSSRVDVISYGEERPSELGSDEFAWSKNRRAVSAELRGAN